jgi:hypothetical protein
VEAPRLHAPHRRAAADGGDHAPLGAVGDQWAAVERAGPAAGERPAERREVVARVEPEADRPAALEQEHGFACLAEHGCRGAAAHTRADDDGVVRHGRPGTLVV